MKKRWLAILMAFTMSMSLLPMNALATGEGEVDPTPALTQAIYVSASGNDGNSGTSEESPVATLARAVEIAPDGAMIYVMDDLEMETGARYWDKSLTITSLDPENPVTVTRGTAMDVIDEDYHDPSRNRYIGSMLEVGGAESGSSTASLTLENIIFDDGGPAETLVRFYMQQSTEGTGYFPIKETTENEDGTKETVITGFYIYNTTKSSTGLSVVGAKEDEEGKKIPDAASIPEGWAPLTNRQIVHDAIIANYDGTAKITLGTGAVLQNFGGMSAVRLSGGELVMKAGSKIEDTTVTDRKKMVPTPGKDPDKKTYSIDYGPAGAIWVQGGALTLEEGSEISNVIGRAVYVDGGTAYINGTIQNITSDPQMWQKESGSSIHIRNDNPKVTLGPGCRIGCTEDFTKKNNGSAIAITGSTGADFTMEKGAVIHNLNGVSAIAINSVKDADFTMEKGAAIHDLNGASAIAISSATDSTFVVDGEISGMKNGGNALNYQTAIDSVLTVGKNADIHDNVVWYGTIYMQTYGSTLHFYGKLHDNYSTDHCGGIMLANNFGPDNVIMYEGAEIKNNIASKTSGGVCVTTGTFTMKGGEISGNISKNEGGGVYVRRGGTFIMEGGSITGNTSGTFGGGVAFDASNYDTEISDDKSKDTFTPSATLMGGTIAGNVSGSVTLNGTNHTATVTEQKSNDLAITATAYGHSTRYLNITDDITIGNFTVYFATNTKSITPDDDSLNIKLGNASGDSITDLSSASTTKGWNSPIATFWTQRDGAAGLTVGGLAALNSNLPVYVLTQKTRADGKPAVDAEVKVYAAAVEDGNVRFTLPTADVNGDGCAVAIVQPTADYGTLTITGPELIKQTLADEEYPVSYTVTYAMSDNMRNIIDVAKESGKEPVYTLALSPDVALTGNVDTSSFNGTTITVHYTLPFAAFDTAEDLFSSALLTITLDDVNYVIPSNAAETQLIGLLTVTFDANGGAFAGGSTTREVRTESGSTISLPANPSRSDRTFTGWNTKADGTGETFTSATVVNGDLTVYAQWNKNHTGGGGNHKPPVLNTEDHYGYIVGYPDGTVQPEGNITRAEVATIFFRLLTDDARTDDWSQTSSYSDVSSSDWFNAAVCTLSKAGILSGYEDGSFHPNGKITRAEFAAIASRFFEYKDASGENPFSDVEEGAWYYKYIMAASEMGLINGYPDGTFGPQKSITRAEACAIVNRTLDRHPDQDHFLKDMLVWVDNMDTGKWYYEDMQEATNSHEYVVKGTGTNKYEEWTEILEVRDWPALEKEWSDANSAAGGEVVK